jgi:putative nucleotidyltransferase with HDIG domain
MPEKSLRVLYAAAEVTDLILLRRLLRDTPYHIDAARTAALALKTLDYRKYAALIADDERLPGMSGAQLLAEVERCQPHVLRILLARIERVKMLTPAARAGRYRLIVRPNFASHVHAALLEHVPRAHRAQLRIEPRAQPRVEPRSPPRSLPMPPVPPAEPQTTPHELEAGGPVARRRMLLTLSELVEAKARHGAGHGLRVSTLAGALGRETGLSRGEIESLEEAALLHDVGELALDASLLTLPRRLTPAELRLMRSHVEAGHQIARRSGLARVVVEAIRHHHERWDGRGYPDRLAGPKIPLAARMIAVADTWDALATARPYKPHLPVDECLRTLALLGGSQLDGALVDLFARRRIYESIDWANPPGSNGLLAPPWDRAADGRAR